MTNTVKKRQHHNTCKGTVALDVCKWARVRRSTSTFMPLASMISFTLRLCRISLLRKPIRRSLSSLSEHYLKARTTKAYKSWPPVLSESILHAHIYACMHACTHALACTHKHTHTYTHRSLDSFHLFILAAIMEWEAQPKEKKENELWYICVEVSKASIRSDRSCSQ